MRLIFPEMGGYLVSPAKPPDQLAAGSNLGSGGSGTNFVASATPILRRMRACLRELDGLDKREAGVAAAQLSHAIESLQQALDRRSNLG